MNQIEKESSIKISNQYCSFKKMERSQEILSLESLSTR